MPMVPFQGVRGAIDSHNHFMYDIKFSFFALSLLD